MRKWIGVAAGLLLACGSMGPAMAAQPSEQQVRQLFEVMHLAQTYGQMNSQMAGVMAQAVPCVSASYWQNFIDTSGAQQLLSRMVPIYQSHFTAEDIAGLLKFYQSPLGQKVVMQMPLTVAESAKIGQQWMRERGQVMIKSLQQKGTLDANGRCPATPAATPPAPVAKPAH
ncbi:DUF2059 domain-containing protein [Rhodanobacter sp. C05]|uniref:DUF2059 domain-containing protein n=1 Tax=Rhodanobacter sp. C05 TaxID=1945855 RepID=UPI000985959D|nr:DUF2059 domain-containing protein [Rhodanobacter sp. C05]OOG39197.1 hypothetical protein B0E51_11595 [Rhodanobacter sp. C05]